MDFDCFLNTPKMCKSSHQISKHIPKKNDKNSNFWSSWIFHLLYNNLKMLQNIISNVDKLTSARLQHLESLSFLLHIPSPSTQDSPLASWSLSYSLNFLDMSLVWATVCISHGYRLSSFWMEDLVLASAKSEYFGSTESFDWLRLDYEALLWFDQTLPHNSPLIGMIQLWDCQLYSWICHSFSLNNNMIAIAL